METTVTIIDLLKQLAVAIPVILVATQTITAAIHGAFKITSDNWNHAISWIVAVLAGLGFVAFNGLTFGLGYWDYLFGALCGLCVGGMSNGWYDWPAIKNIIDAITNLFGGNKMYLTRMYKEEYQLKERIDKLSGFIQSNKTFMTLPATKRVKLEQQLEYMKHYEKVLAERIQIEQQE